MLWLRRHSWRAFDLGAAVYAWFTSQSAWRSACRRLAERLPERPPPEQPSPEQPSPERPPLERRRPGRGGLPDRGGLPARSERLVADLGCGPGVSAIELARARPDVRVIGLDLAPRMLREARRRVHAAGLPPDRLLLLRADAARLPFRSDTLDALTGHSFLYLVPDRAATLAESRRVLRGGGRLILMEPHARPARLGTVFRVSRDPRHLLAVALWRPFSRFHGRFTATSLTATLEAAGFTRCRVEPVLGGLGLLASAEKPVRSDVGGGQHQRRVDAAEAEGVRQHH